MHIQPKWSAKEDETQDQRSPNNDQSNVSLAHVLKSLRVGGLLV
jgi:hypothetical protein